MMVPPPQADSISRVPPARVTRSRIPTSPSRPRPAAVVGGPAEVVGHPSDEVVQSPVGGVVGLEYQPLPARVTGPARSQDTRSVERCLPGVSAGFPADFDRPV